MDNFVKVEKNDARKKMVNIRNIEPISNITVVRDHSDSESMSNDVSSDDSSIDSESIAPKKTKKVFRNKVTKKHYQSPQQQQRNHDYGFISNPKKMNKNVSENFEEDSEYSSEEASENSLNYSEEDAPQEPKISFEDRQKLKQDLLIKIQALEIKGFEFSKKFNMTSNYDEMIFEYEKIKKFIESQGAIKFSRRCLMACVTGIEFLNKRFDPFHVKLDGWSENVMESVDDYDNIFEKLHEKYSKKAEIAPEIELLLTLGGSAFMFHLTNSLLKGSSGIPNGGAIAQNNPNFMANMMKTMSQMSKDQSKPPNFNTDKSGNLPKPVDTRGVRKEMRGPSLDPNLFSGTPLATNYPKPPGKGTFSSADLRQFYEENPVKEDDIYSVASSDSSLSSVSLGSTIKTINKKKGKNGGVELNIS